MFQVLGQPRHRVGDAGIFVLAEQSNNFECGSHLKSSHWLFSGIGKAGREKAGFSPGFYPELPNTVAIAVYFPSGALYSRPGVGVLENQRVFKHSDPSTVAVDGHWLIETNC
jgi:hypothetical protein